MGREVLFCTKGLEWAGWRERAKDGRGLVAAMGWRFSVGGAGTEPPNSLTRRGAP